MPNLDFIAIKVGDLNNSATLDEGCFTSPDEPEDRSFSSQQIGIELPKSFDKGDVLAVPFRHVSDKAIPAIQMGIGFDENALSFIGTSKGDLERVFADNFGLTEVDEGRIRMLWYNQYGKRGLPKKGDALFYLSFKVEMDIANSADVIWLDDGILTNRRYADDGAESRLELKVEHSILPTNDEVPFTATFYPNPFDSAPVIEVSSKEVMPATLWLFDAFGVRVAHEKVELEQGRNTFTLDEMTDLPAGIYTWKVKTKVHKAKGVAVKQ